MEKALASREEEREARVSRASLFFSDLEPSARAGCSEIEDVIRSKLRATLRLIPEDAPILIQAIPFSGVGIVQIEIDGVDVVAKTPELKGGMVVYEELMASAVHSGRFLIITSPTGFADSGGFELVTVQHESEATSWKIPLDRGSLRISFDAVQYKEELARLEAAVQQSGVPVEPQWFAYPESELEEGSD